MVSLQVMQQLTTYFWVMQGSKTKGKAKAGHRSVCIHPEALKSMQEQSASECEVDTLDREIAVTTLLIEKFNAHSSVWEGMEVDVFSSQMQSVTLPSGILICNAQNSTRAENV